MAGDPFNNLNPVFSTKLQQMIAASGGLLRPGSGFRTYEQQAKLYDDFIHGRNNQARAAAPGRSNHNHGLAMDLVDAQTGKAVQAGSEADKWLKANAARYGLVQAVPGEAWHVELADGDEARSAIQGAQSMGALGTDPIEPQSPEDRMHDRLGQMMAVMSRGTIGAAQAVQGTEQAPTTPTTDTTTMGGTMGGTPLVEPGLGAIPQPGYEPPGKGVERWRPVVVQALRYTGQPTDDATVNLTLRRMAQESGGNPRAVNNWDSNAKKGDPTQGLMQNIPSAFNQRARELAARGITDGFANIVASIRYATDRYGSLQAAYNRRGGY